MINAVKGHPEVDMFGYELPVQPTTLPRPASRPRRRWPLLLALLLVVCLAAGGGVYAYIQSMLNQVKRVEVDRAALSCVDMDGYVNILLLGIDARDMESTEGSRTDCMMILSIKEETGEVYLTSIYRDSFLKMGDLGLFDKVNQAFAYGGPELAIQSVNEALDLNIDKYVLFNFKAVADVVDELEGLTINVEDYEIEELNKYTEETAETIGRDSYHLVTAHGEQKLDGCQVVSYGRIRYGVGDDIKRTERMRTVMSLLLDEARSMGLGQLNELLNTVLPQIQTNLSNSDMMALAGDASEYTLVGSSSFPYQIIEGHVDGGSYVFALDLEADVKALHETVFGQKDYQPTPTCVEISNIMKGYS